MMVEENSPIVNQATRLTTPNISIELARYRNLSDWKPKLGDFIIWHGWFGRWYGVVNSIVGNQIGVVKENLPKLLFTMPESDRNKNTIVLKIDKIKVSGGGEYHVLQDGYWHID